MKDSIVNLNDISLKFNIDNNRATSLKEFCVRWLKRDLRHGEFWALKLLFLQHLHNGTLD